MKRMTATAAALIVAVLALFQVNARAQDFNPLEKTYLTFSGTVELPGMTLPAGTYTFKLADTPSRNVVQVLSRDEREIHGQFLFVQSQRLETSGETVVMFKESPEGTTPAVQYWYYPGESIGKEFVYPKDQATRIATRTGQTVLSTDGDIAANPEVTKVDVAENAQSAQNAPPAARVESGGQVVAQAQAPATPAPPAQAPAAQAPSAPLPAAQEPAFNDAALPTTASPLPLAALLGLLSLAGGVGLRTFRG